MNLITVAEPEITPVLVLFPFFFLRSKGFSDIINFIRPIEKIEFFPRIFRLLYMLDKQTVKIAITEKGFIDYGCAIYL